MQRKPQPIPVKWYLASLVGALCLALVLMTTFEILGRGNPRAVSKLNGISLDEDPTVSEAQAAIKPIDKPEPQNTIQAVHETQNPIDSHKDMIPSTRPESKPKPIAAQKPPQNLPAPQLQTAQQVPQQPSTQSVPSSGPSLWSLLISPALIYAAATIVAAGSVILIRKAVLNRRQQVL